MAKTYKLRDLIAETYTANEAKFFGYADRGNGSGFGEPGQCIAYDDDCARKYGDIEVTACLPIRAEGSEVEFVYTSDWIDAENGLQFRVML